MVVVVGVGEVIGCIGICNIIDFVDFILFLIKGVVLCMVFDDDSVEFSIVVL